MKFKNWLVIASVFILQPTLTPSLALAKKKSPPKAYSFIVEGGKASQGECDGERKIPRKLKHQKDIAKYGSYMGSELQDPPIKGKPGEEMWKHFFRSKPACNAALAKTPSSLDQSLQNEKKELPEDDSADTDDEPEKPSDGPDTE
ncbi:hypothetical protein B9G69_002570 [Bdellovibrio sp. SKB1291214]|uniref:hypothetical protein n=1 Tax=Bdellovibrio sp. SKB1291214 TaxID=1732569 RepID=UPI00223F7A7C|nr:hypothetical protein [Bdellovibrio sp. SKB1291214]UYL09455.1 hypothetical protein B9G69_002570 [Bdellovibrio sp. SKB1291214]